MAMLNVGAQQDAQARPKLQFLMSGSVLYGGWANDPTPVRRPTS